MKKTLLFSALSMALGLRAASVDHIAAKVGTEIITSLDVEGQLNLVDASMSDVEKQSADGQKKLAEDRKKILDQMIEQKLVLLAAAKGPDGYKEAVDKGTAPANPYQPTGLEVEEQLDKVFDESRSHYPSQEAFEAELKRQKLSLTEFRSKLRDLVRDKMTVERMSKEKQKEFQPMLRVTDEEAEAFYNEHKTAFAVGDQVLLRHILFKFEDQAKAEAALKQLQASKHLESDFSRLAKRESHDDLTADKGGRLGWIEKGGLRWAAVEEAAFTTPVGHVAGPLRSQEGWHLIYVEDKKSGEQKPFDEVKAQARNAVYQEKLQKRMQDWVEDLKREFFVERHDD